MKTEVFHGFDAGKPRHIYIRGFFDLYCTTGPRDTRPFAAIADKLQFFSVRETGWPKLDPFMREHATPEAAARARTPGDSVSLDVLAFVERGADSVRHDQASSSQRSPGTGS